MKCLILFISLWLFSFKLSFAELAYIAPYNALLKEHISHGEKEGVALALVNYGAWSVDSRHTEALSLILDVNPNQLTGKEKLAYWINAYNLLTIDLIVTQNERTSIKDIGSFITNPWKDYSWVINDKEYTLDQIEHNVLRQMNEPRIHMAINCASISCPDLRQEAYIPEKLDEQLQEQVIKFLNNSDKGVKRENDSIYVSKIFDWFEDDFEVSGDVLLFIAKYCDWTTKNDEISGYLPYNWNLNGSW